MLVDGGNGAGLGNECIGVIWYTFSASGLARSEGASAAGGGAVCANAQCASSEAAKAHNITALKAGRPPRRSVVAK